jgi:hypothetical protein
MTAIIRNAGRRYRYAVKKREMGRFAAARGGTAGCAKLSRVTVAIAAPDLTPHPSPLDPLSPLLRLAQERGEGLGEWGEAKGVPARP